jgi:hypothetical protein
MLLYPFFPKKISIRCPDAAEGVAVLVRSAMDLSLLFLFEGS